jgi:GT2 family glycosyltransferase
VDLQTMPARTVISILVWDSPIYTRNLLLNLDWAVPGKDCRIIILDQGSAEETRSFVRSYAAERPNVMALLLDRNIGYGAGHNLVYRSALEGGAFDYFITLNSDSLFPEPGWADEMVGAMDANPDAAIGGPLGYGIRDSYFVPSSKQQLASGDFLFITGAVAIIRAKAVREHGLFDEIYTPAYWEDADMVLRYRHYGWRQLFVDIPILHGYLGEKIKVNQQKREQLKAEFGEFQNRNMREFMTRYLGPQRAALKSDPLSWSPRLFRPGP